MTSATGTEFLFYLILIKLNRHVTSGYLLDSTDGMLALPSIHLSFPRIYSLTVTSQPQLHILKAFLWEPLKIFLQDPFLSHWPIMFLSPMLPSPTPEVQCPKLISSPSPWLSMGWSWYSVWCILPQKPLLLHLLSLARVYHIVLSCLLLAAGEHSYFLPVGSYTLGTTHKNYNFHKFCS